jgi:hypothetical protein
MDSTWLAELWALPAVQMLAWALLAGAIGLLWGFAEIIGAFKNETGRALRTGGAWLILWLNFAAAMVTFLLVAAIIPEARSWLAAAAAGLAWPTILRNTTVKLAQPLQPGQQDDSFALRFERAYGSVQSLARQLINTSLTRQRMKLVARATELDLAELEKQARLAVISSPLPPGEGGPPDEFITRIMQREDPDEIKKALLAAFILQFFDRSTLDDMLRTRRKKPAQAAPAAQP